MLMLVRRTHASMFWLGGESKTHHLTAYQPFGYASRWTLGALGRC